MFKDIQCPSCGANKLTHVVIDEENRNIKLICYECNCFSTVYFDFTTAIKPGVNKEAGLRKRLGTKVENMQTELAELKETIKDLK
jgi:uncharacterized Zn finger protein